MKAKKMTVILCSLMLAALFFVVPKIVEAQQTLGATATINRIMQNETFVDIFMDQVPAQGIATPFTNKIFRIQNTTKQKEMLAVALTALSTGKPVRVIFIDGERASVTALGIMN